MSSTRIITVEPVGSDVVAMTQCIAIDAVAFPYASVEFGLRQSAAWILVARTEGDRRVWGFVAGRAKSGILHIEGLAVDVTARRRGFARALVRAVISRARARQLRAVSLHVGVENRAAIALYEAEGFLVDRRLPGFYPARAFGRAVDAYQMSFWL